MTACAPVIVVQQESPVVVVQPGDPIIIHATGEQGPPGPPGAGAGGVTYAQDHEPIGAVEKETWWNPLTLQLKVYHNGQFDPVSPDGGNF